MSSPEFAARRQACAAAIAAFETESKVPLDALVVTSLVNIRYLTGFSGSNGALLIERSGEATLYTDPRYTIQAAAETGLRVVIAKGSLLPRVAKAASRKRYRRVGFESAHLTVAAHAPLAAALGKKLEPASGLVEKLRRRKSADEIARIAASVDLNSRAFGRALAIVKPGRTREIDLAAEIDHQMRKLGATGTAFETIVAAGPRSALPHARPTRTVIPANELLLIDMGASLDGYTSDMTRVVSTGSGLSRRAKQIHAAVLESQLAAIDAVRPGVSAASVDRAARQVLKGHGLDKLFVHSTGHGLGLEIHEAPRLGKKEKTRLEESMAITIEPGVYEEGSGGVRIEDTVIVTATGCRVLTPTPKELIEI